MTVKAEGREWPGGTMWQQNLDPSQRWGLGSHPSPLGYKSARPGAENLIKNKLARETSKRLMCLGTDVLSSEGCVNDRG